ncbi:MAG: SDR family NAD(P)-dependent oxidoreductase [Beijerinckiaceae bacterium]
MMPVYPDLSGKSVLVTGGAEGIGRAIAEAFLAQSARVAILDRNAAAIAAFRAAAPSLIAATVDLTDIPATQAAIQEVEKQAGAFTVLVNNAGNDERHAFADVTPEYWDNCMAINLRHVMFVTQSVVPGMAARGGGSIINLGSTSWMKGAPGIVAYTTAKAAIHGFTRTAAREFGSSLIRVNAIAPGWVMTERQLAHRATPEKLVAALSAQAIPIRIEPNDVAALALYLASDASRAMTGQTMILDAGTGDR